MKLYVSVKPESQTYLPSGGKLYFHYNVIKFFFRKLILISIFLDSRRLAGGASGPCVTSGASSQTDMCCRSPATVKTPCTGPPPSRGTCPAEIENKLAAYGNSTKQLVQFQIIVKL